MSTPQPFAERDYYQDPRRRAKSLAVRAASRLTRRAGIDLELRHWYSPIPQIEEIDPGFWARPSAMPGVAPFETGAMLEYLDRELAAGIAEFDPPRRWSGRHNDYFLENGLFQSVDADVLYAMVRRYRPKKIIELGAGFSTLVTARACATNAQHGDPATFVSCDPYALAPTPGQVPGLSELRPVRAEAVPIAEFEALEADDILFIDSSHTVRIGGDVTHLFSEVLPRLADGVIVHLHDIYLPWSYPRDWVVRNRWYWAEQYMLQSFLTFNDHVSVLWASHAVFREQPERLARAIPNRHRGDPAPLSLWMRVRS